MVSVIIDIDLNQNRCDRNKYFHYITDIQRDKSNEADRTLLKRYWKGVILECSLAI